jgi:chitin synthase
MRYSAVTSDPDDFVVANGWSPRTKIYERNTEILIAITSCDKDKTLYARTLHGMMLNIRDICKTNQNKSWKRSTEQGQPGWQRVTVALIINGLGSMDGNILDILTIILSGRCNEKTS